MQEEGAMPAMKRMTYRVVNKIRPFKRRDRSASYLTDMQVDPEAPLGIRKLPEMRHASFSKHAESQPHVDQ